MSKQFKPGGPTSVDNGVWNTADWSSPTPSQADAIWNSAGAPRKSSWLDAPKKIPSATNPTWTVERRQADMRQASADMQRPTDSHTYRNDID